MLTQRYVAPSSRYRSSQYPAALARHLMNHLTPTPGPTALPVLTAQPEKLDHVNRRDQDDQRTGQAGPPHSGGFLGVSISMSMGIRNWAWPTFGKGSNPKELATNTSNGVIPNPASGRAEAQVDQSALEDAISSESSFGLPTEKPSAVDDHEKDPAKLDDNASTPRASRASSLTTDSSEPLPNCSQQGVDASTTPYREKSQFTWTDVFASPSNESLSTSRRRVYLLKVSPDNVVMH